MVTCHIHPVRVFHVVLEWGCSACCDGYDKEEESEDRVWTEHGERVSRVVSINSSPVAVWNAQWEWNARTSVTHLRFVDNLSIQPF
jgi:hypothetical protein